MTQRAPYPHDSPSLSVVVIGRNEGERLTRCLASVRALRWPQEEIELIYVDSASRDDSVQRAADCGATVIEAQSTCPCAAIGRNLGWCRATAPFVLFLDGDTILHPDFVAQAVPMFTDPRIAAVSGQRRELHPQNSVYQRVLDLDWLAPSGPSLFCGGDALMRRAVLMEVGGYDENLIAGEEPELCQRMRARGYMIWRTDAPMTQHDLAITRWAQYWRRAQRTGYAYALIAGRADTDQQPKNLASLSVTQEGKKAEPPASQSLQPLWVHEARHNIIHAVMLSSLLLYGLAHAVVMQSLLPLGWTGALLVALVVRTAYRARWRSANLVTLLLYGVHSHLQQLPMFLGQLGYWRDCRIGRKQPLMEYKEAR